MANLTPKRILTDVVGYTCLILAPLVGWLPGPGAIPLILAGLGLLSINNDWAKKLLHYVRERSETLRDVIFPDNKLVQWGWDIFVVLIVTAGVTNSIYTDNKLIRATSFVMFALAATVFLFNRHRLRWLDSRVRKRKR